MTKSKPSALLLTSLVLNLVLIGLFAGLMLNRISHDRSRGLNAGAERSQISSASREAVRGAFQAANEAAEGARGRHNEARKRLQEVLSATDFDAIAAKAAFADLEATNGAIQIAMQDSLIDEMAAMSKEERASIAQRLTRRRGRQGRGQDRRFRGRE